MSALMRVALFLACALWMLPVWGQAPAPLPPEVLFFDGGPVVPVQPLAVLYGWSLTRDLRTGAVTVARGAQRFTCTPMSREAQANGQALTLPLLPVERRGAIYMPATPLLAALGGKARLDPDTQTYGITLPDLPPLVCPMRIMTGTSQAFADDDTEVYVMKIDGSGLQRLTYDSVPNGLPALSADGTQCAYTVGGDLYVRSPAGTRCLYRASTTTDAELPLAVRARCPLFSPDGRLVYFQEQTFNPKDWSNPRDSTIRSIGTDGAGKTVIAKGRELRVNAQGVLAYAGSDGNIHVRTPKGDEKVIGKGWWPYFSADGARVAYIGARTYHSIYLYDLVGPQAGTTVEPPAGFPANHAVMWPSFSPDGTQISFADTQKGLCIMRADYTQVRILTKDVRNVEWSYFTPDGGQIIFYGQGAGFWTIKPDGTNLRMLHPGVREINYTERFTLTPDGAHILFTMVP